MKYSWQKKEIRTRFWFESFLKSDQLRLRRMCEWR